MNGVENEFQCILLSFHQEVKHSLRRILTHFFVLFLILDFFLKDSVPAFSGLKEEIVSKPVIVKIGSIEVSGSYFTLERFVPYPLTSIIFLRQ